MRMAMIVPSLLNKAPILVARDLAVGLIGRGVDVTIYYLDDKIELIFPCSTKKFNVRLIGELRSYDLIHSHCFRPDLLVAFLRWFGLIKGSCLTTIHNVVEKDLGYAYGSVVSAVGAFCWRAAWSVLTARVVLSAQARDYYLGFQSHLSFDVIANGRSLCDVETVDPADHELLSRLRLGKKVLGSFAAISDIKGLEQVVQALGELNDCIFLIIGDGPALSKIINLAEKLGVSEKVFAIGYRLNARAYMQYVDCYLMPSRSEGMPLALIEAALAARPIVCSDIPAFRAMFSDEEVVFFTLDSIDTLVYAIKFALNHADRFGRAAFHKINLNYSSTKMVENYLTLYRKLIGKESNEASNE